jgi:tetratricopeptide (TPR) repeat protein
VGRFAILAVALLVAPASWSADQSAATREAVAAMRQGDFPSAERMLRSEAKAHPDDPWVLSLLGVALDNQKKITEAEPFHARAVSMSPRSAEILTNFGTHLWSAAQYNRAETLFASALAASPAYFTALLNLGVMATYTGHYARAREALTAAVEQQPQNAEALYRLACVDEASGQWESAVMRLAQAAKLNPLRADVQRLLAVATSELGALDDSIAAWDRYLKLAPNDEIARRERAYAFTKIGKVKQGIAELEDFAARHPDDPIGHYELGRAVGAADISQALRHLDKALALNPNYVSALSARGDLYEQQSEPESAVKDLELAASLEPENAAILDRLGKTYLDLDRTDDAVRVLRKAVALTPEDSTITFHLGRSLADAGLVEESKAVMSRFRQLGPEKGIAVPAGLVEYLSLPPEERYAAFRARVEKAVHDQPDDPAAQLEYLRLTIEDGNADRVAATARRIAGVKPGAALLAQTGRALLSASYYALAQAVLEQASAAGGDVSKELSLATLHTSGGAIDAGAIGRALGEPARRPGLYLQETAFLVKLDRAQEALRLIDVAALALPENREILLMQATTLDLAGQSDGAGHLLIEIRTRWPEWSAAWAAHGILLGAHRQYDESRQLLETAVALGARSAEVYFYLADCALHGGRKDAAESLIGEALRLRSADPWIQLLAGRIAFAKGKYQLAADRESAAIRQRPHWIEAHRNLAQAYSAVGQHQEADAELAFIGGAQQDAATDSPPYLKNLYEGSLLTGKPLP